MEILIIGDPAIGWVAAAALLEPRHATVVVEAQVEELSIPCHSRPIALPNMQLLQAEAPSQRPRKPTCLARDGRQPANPRPERVMQSNGMRRKAPP